MSERLRVGIAGYGIVGKRRRFFIDLHPQLKTVAICDRTFSRDAPSDGVVRVYNDYRELIEKEQLDLLFVCLTNDVAADATRLGLEAGLHVFCEKPPARNLRELNEVIQCESRFPRAKLKYGFNHRYHDSFRYALSVLRGGELGKVINIRGVYGKSKLVSYESDWRAQRKVAGGGILLDQGIHMVDMMRLLAGDEFHEVHSFVTNTYWNHDVEDNAYALMRTPDGIVAMLHSSATQWRHRFHLEISLSDGAVILQGILSGSKTYGEEEITVARKGKGDLGIPPEQTFRYNQDNSWADEIAEFVELILSDKPVVNGSSSEARKTLELIYRIYAADPDWRSKFLSGGY